MGFFEKIGIHIICFVLGLGGIFASVYAVSLGNTGICIILCIASNVVSVFGFAIGIASGNARKACECECKEEEEK